MRKISIYLIFLLSISNFLSAQKRSNGRFGHDLPGVFSIMLSGVGPAYLFGDVGGKVQDQMFLGNTDWDMAKTRFLYSIGFRQLFPNNFGLKATLAYGQFAGTDEGTSNPTRGYSFTSDITELSIQSEYTLYGGPYSKVHTPSLLYVFAGAGVLSYRPNLIRDGGPRPTDIIETDGLTPVMPFGIGYQYQVSPRFAIGAEFGWRYTFTDFLDGVSTINSRSNDVLSNLNFTFTYKVYGGVPNAGNCNCNWW